MARGPKRNEGARPAAITRRAALARLGVLSLGAVTAAAVGPAVSMAGGTTLPRPPARPCAPDGARYIVRLRRRAWRRSVRLVLVETATGRELDLAIAAPEVRRGG